MAGSLSQLEAAVREHHDALKTRLGAKAYGLLVIALSALLLATPSLGCDTSGGGGDSGPKPIATPKPTATKPPGGLGPDGVNVPGYNPSLWGP